MERKTLLFRFLFLYFFITIFILLLFTSKSFLSPKWWIDATRVESFLINPDGIEGSFKTTAETLYFFGKNSALIWQILAAVFFLTILSSAVKDLQTFFILAIISMATMLLNSLWLGKEIIVMILSSLVYLIYRYTLIHKRVFFYSSVLFLYCGYAYFFRSYYILIILYYSGFIFLHMRFKFSPWLSFIFLVIITSLLPDLFFQISQGQRNDSNAYADILGMDNRTRIDNLVKVSGSLNYLINYFWAAFNMFLVIIFHHTISDLILQTYTFIYLVIMASNSYTKEINKSDLLLLFSSHVFVQILFEPDLGSFFRHSLSVFVYLIPSIKILFEKGNRN